MQNRYVRGSWNAICDICGFRHKASELLLDSDNHRVCQSCFDPQHPIENLRIPREDPGVPWARPPNPNPPFIPGSGIGVWAIGVNFTIPPYRTVQALTVSGGIVRVECLNHKFTNLDTITMRGAVDSAYNGEFTITLLDANHFIYTASPAADENPAVGVTADGIIKDVNQVTFNRWLVEDWEAA